MYEINKVIGYLISPVGLVLMLVAAAAVARMLDWRRLSGVATFCALANLWVWSTLQMSTFMGGWLEAEFMVDGRVPAIERLPQADMIALHGGAVGVATNLGYEVELWTNADRVWQAARLWKAGKAPRILVMSEGTDVSTGPLLADLGVPNDAIAYDFGPRNTEEEARAVARVSGEAPVKVLVVTSAWHMKRTLLMYEKYAKGVKAIPAPCDFENSLLVRDKPAWKMLLPDPTALMLNCCAFHEWIGYLGYKWLR